MFGPFAMQNALCDTVAAIIIDGEPSLLSFDQSASPERMSADLPFISCGSGQQIADPFLALIRRLFWPDRLPTLAEGKFAIFWTLHHAIETHPGGVAAPMQIVVVQKETAQWKARQLLSERLKEIEEHVLKMEAHIKDFGKASTPTSPPDFASTTKLSPPESSK